MAIPIEDLIELGADMVPIPLKSLKNSLEVISLTHNYYSKYGAFRNDIRGSYLSSVQNGNAFTVFFVPIEGHDAEEKIMMHDDDLVVLVEIYKHEPYVLYFENTHYVYDSNASHFHSKYVSINGVIGKEDEINRLN